MNNKALSGGIAGAASIILVALMFVTAWFAGNGWNWLITAGLMAGFMFVIGLYRMGRPLGILITERNVMSLSRFQMALWTVILLSAYLVMALVRIKAGAENPLAIEIDWRLWALMGISTTSLIGTPLMQTSKKLKEPDPDEIAKVAKTFQEGKKDVDESRQGVLYGNSDSSSARFSDLFEGDELKNSNHIDLAKIQMFFFTLVAAFSYCAILFNTIVAAKDDMTPLDHFPIVSDGFVALLGISNAGYLTSKTVDHTKTVEPGVRTSGSTT